MKARQCLIECCEGCLIEENNRFYVSENRIPDSSTCFWINDKPLRKIDFCKEDGRIKKQLAYMDGTSRWDKDIAHVGWEDTPQIVPEGI